MRKQSELDSNQEQLLYNVATALGLEHKHVLAHLLETYYTDYGSHIDTLKALIQVKEKLIAETSKLHDTIENLRLNEKTQLDTTILEAIDLIKTRNEDKINPEKINQISDLMSYISYTIDEYVKHKRNYTYLNFGEYHKTFEEFIKNKNLYLDNMEEEFKYAVDDDQTFVGYDDDELEVQEEIKQTEILKSDKQKRIERIKLLSKIIMYIAIFIIGGALLIDGVVLLWKALIMAKEHIFNFVSWIKG